MDRARQLAGNIETQAQILRATEIYNLEARQLQLERQLGDVGRHIPALGKTIHDTQLAHLIKRETKLRQDQKDSGDLLAATWPAARLAPRPGSRKAKPLKSDQQTLDAFT